MDYNSEEDLEISESEIEEYSEKPYKQLRDGKDKVKNKNGTFKCPYCCGKKKQDYKFQDLLQHASGVASSCTRSEKQKANHLALARYLTNDLADKSDQILTKAVNQPEKQEENCVWPWTGIIVNIKNNKLHDSRYWLKEFARYKPVDVHVFLNDGDDLTAEAVIVFNNDWNGFTNACDFEKSFENSYHGKKDWNSKKMKPSSSIYGWVAREDDYKCRGPIGEYLRNKGKLRTVSDIVQEASQSGNNIVENLANEIDITNENLNKMQCKYNETTMSLRRMMEQKDNIQMAFIQDTRIMQLKAHNEVKRILDEQEKLSNELDLKRNNLVSWARDLERRKTQTDQERMKLEEDKKKKDLRNESLELASKEAHIADKNVLRLLEEQKREKQEAYNKMLQLQKKLDTKLKLEMEIEELKGQLEVYKHIGNQDDEATQKRIKEMTEELQEKRENLEDSQALNQTLIVKERQSNDELQDARKELIQGLNELLNAHKTNIGIKRMGELDQKVFVNACKKRFRLEEASIKGVELCSLWQENVKNSAWHPFKVCLINDKPESIIDEGDEKLQKLKKNWGDEIHSAVVTALKEINEYNPSGGYTVNELWNFKENRKATLKEVMAYIAAQIKPTKRKKT